MQPKSRQRGGFVQRRAAAIGPDLVQRGDTAINADFKSEEVIDTCLPDLLSRKSGAFVEGNQMRRRRQHRLMRIEIASRAKVKRAI
ncbi:hypothetical protein IAG25_28065 [Caballeronia sp. EK]|uniref:hypothetical protein n=1 Tax=Caballeronia sp. EK TaxID=2767469 RepID=UPI0016558C8A|nr:hypothetical protein [Caballeronia sp. EK]MBC8640683.1 hypothetical protein [Caballeronia sp. EK]